MRTSVGLALAVCVLAALGSAGPSAVDPAAAASTPTAVGLALNYGFDNDSGVVARDSSTNAIHGTYINTTAAAARSTGVPGRSWAITLVGAQHQYISVPERDALDVDRFTLAALVLYTGVANDETFGRWEVLEKADAYWINVRTNGRVRVGGFFGGCTYPSWKYLDSTVPIPRNTWTHVASTYNGSTLTVWVNGSRAGSKAVTGQHLPSTTCRSPWAPRTTHPRDPRGLLGRAARRHPHLPAGTVGRRDPRLLPG